MDNAIAIAPNPAVAQEPEPVWAMSGAIDPAKVSLFYKLGMAAVAVAMVLLPLLYVALIGAVAYATYRHGIDRLDLFEGRGNAQGKLILYVGPLIVGALVAIFMVKPLFARRPRQVEPTEVARDEQPALFEFIDRICDLVRAPCPKRVQLDLQVNASASFRRGFLSLFRNDLTLTIGLPLAAGLTVRQLGGVLAHEFGHFAQGAGMRLTFIIRSVNAWFYRVVYERDAWDEGLANAAKNIDFRIGIILHLARLMIWLTRKLLWVFMSVGHGISCFMLRQMEFDADHYEAQVAGSRGFAETAARLRLLSVGWQRTLAQQQEAFQGKRLVDNLPGLIALETQRLPAETADAVSKAALAEKTGWFDTHPSDAARVQAAAAAATDGVLRGEAPASALFADFDPAAQRITEAFYREECELDLGGVRLLPLSEMAAEASAQAEAELSMKEFFGNLLTIRSMVFLSPGDLRRSPGGSDKPLVAAPVSQAVVPEATRAAGEALLKADAAEVLAHQARALLAAGFTIKKQEFQLSAATAQAADAALEQVREQVAQHRAGLDGAIAAVRARLIAALELLGLPYASDASAVAKEAGELLSVLGRFEETQLAMVALRNDHAALEILLNNATNAGDAGKWSTAAGRLATSVQRSVLEILSKVQGVNYPFAHGQGTVLLADYLGECASHHDENIQSYHRGEAVLGRCFSTYHRIVARLAALARQAETTFLR